MRGCAVCVCARARMCGVRVHKYVCMYVRTYVCRLVVCWLDGFLVESLAGWHVGSHAPSIVRLLVRSFRWFSLMFAWPLDCLLA